MGSDRAVTVIQLYIAFWGSLVISSVWLSTGNWMAGSVWLVLALLIAWSKSGVERAASTDQGERRKTEATTK